MTIKGLGLRTVRYIDILEIIKMKVTNVQSVFERYDMRETGSNLNKLK